ncbi:hypothetical protein CERSUDRAFT_112406 [Gelatoporia subvermispora B]|uniref:MYND-type domain-containing protein n=1 Tax=Ceriporiopsis subvermispora (strain B) TaxID=914234 RepID=M2R6F7_CERS8|nr:hypothetical protein CERSUDRAFT_112406 [Gelatoporia subvermispora B]
MPGPRARAIANRSNTASTLRQTHQISYQTLARDVEEIEGWNTIVSMLCDYFDLPDLTTRSGLKKVHARFGDIYDKLDQVYICSRDSPKIMGGIVAIWAKMSADSILRNKLFQKGFLCRIIPLLDIALTRLAALQAIAVITHHGGSETRVAMTREAPALIRSMEECQHDVKVAELCFVSLMHSVGTTLMDTDKSYGTLIRTADVRILLKIAVDNLRSPEVTSYLTDHALGLLTSVALHFPKEYRAHPPVLTYLVACLRSTNIVVRCEALLGLLRLHYRESEEDRHLHDPHKLMAVAASTWPPRLNAAMLEYGFEECDITKNMQNMRDFQRAMFQCAQNHDLYALGKTLADIVMRSEFSIMQGAFEFQDEKTGAFKRESIGLPFIMWADSLPHCAAALRKKGTPADLDTADTLDLKYLIIEGRHPDAVALARKAIARNSKLVYAYYAIGLGQDSAEGLRAAKKGLKCKGLTPFMRNYLQWRAVAHAGDLGVSNLQDTRAGNKEYTESVAILMSAYEDAKAFISTAPPDSRNMGMMLNWLVLLTLVIRGPELSTDLHELKPIFDKIDLSDQIMTFMGHPPKRTQLRLTRELILRLYPTAIKEWAEDIVRIDALSSTASDMHLDADKAQDDLAAWLDKHKVEEGEEQVPERCTHPRIGSNAVELYRCSWCRNPSAMLRKCGGCGKTRYCDAICQKSHWGDHKIACKSA